MASPTSSERWSRPGRLVASLAIVVYLAAVVVPPLAGPPPASGLARAMLQPLRPLVGSLHLGHGYRFFAPDPGPGHSIRWTATLPDGSERSGLIPDRSTDWPRLLYHRRFMVSEKIAAAMPPPEMPAEVRTRTKPDWQPLVKGVAAKLLAEQAATRVRLEMIEHYLPDPEDVIAGTTGADMVTPLGTYAWPREPRR